MAERLLPGAGLVIRCAAAAIWLIAGGAKAFDLTRFHAQVEQYRLLPSTVEALFAYTLPFVEIAVGVYLLAGLLIRAAAIAASVLMALFLIAQSQAWVRGLSLDCGCFGTLSHERVGLSTILRDVALGLPTLVLAAYPARLFSLDAVLLGLPDRFRFAVAADVFRASAAVDGSPFPSHEEGDA